MKLSNLFFLASSSCLSLSMANQMNVTNATAIVSAITVIGSRITTLNNTLNTFSLGPQVLLTALTIQEQSDDLSNAVRYAGRVASASPPLSVTDSGTVAGAVIQLVPQITSLLANIIAHKPVFDHALFGVGSVSPQVESDLKNQENLSNAFATALIAKLANPYAQYAPLVTGQIQSAFENAINIFSQPGGWFPIQAVQGPGEFEVLLGKYLDWWNTPRI